MASAYSFDVTTGVDLQEVDNAVNQAQKESAQRYDFKDAKVLTIEFARTDGVIRLHTDHDMRMRALFDIVQSKLIKRGVPVKNLDVGEDVPAGNDTLKREIKLKQALDSETAKKVSPPSRTPSSRRSRRASRATRCASVGPTRTRCRTP
ncbi:MAG: DUF520 family protein [Gemmatimonadetes bacterium]|nr:DUF520 family protein [Gemmatimonadota bacterium]